jgi:hypothetical protein
MADANYRWMLNSESADCRKATYTSKEGGTASAALVQKHLPWIDATKSVHASLET